MGEPLTPGAKLGIVVGLVAEARIARRLGGVVIAGGGMAAGAQEAAQSLVAQGVSALLSFGLAGGLDPRLPPGTIVIPSAVVVGTRRLATDAGLSAWLGADIPAITLLTAEAPVASVAQKRSLHAASGCAAVDLESGAVADTAHLAGIPFAVLRAICDPADCPLPPAALTALDQRGAIGSARIVASILRQPTQVGSLLTLARNAMAARRALLTRVAALSARPVSG